MALEHGSLSPGRKCQENVSHRDKTDLTSNELDLLFSLMFDELLNGSTKVVSKSSAVSAVDAPNQRQQPTTPLINHTTPAPSCQTSPITTTVISSENINQAEPHAENDEVADDEFINIFSTPVQDKGETSSRHVDSSNMHTFYQRYPSEQRWTKDHPLEQVIGNPSQSVRTRRQLESDAEMCMFALTTMALEHGSLSPGRKCQENVSHRDKTDTTSNEMDLLFSPMFDELLNGSSKVVSKSSIVSAADESIQRQHQPTTPLNTPITHVPTCQTLPITTTVRSSENINQAESHAENDQVAEDEFINIFSILIQDQGETSSRHDHMLEQVIGNPSQSVRTRRQLESDPEMCMFALTVSRTEPKNIKEAMADSAWIESMQEELHQFDRLNV
nr:Gag-Pol polyprotein [Tanacetum cinerariifolium]